MTINDLRQIAREYELNLIEVDEAYIKEMNQTWDWYTNRCMIADPDIEVGPYEDEELRTASVFHEIGHVVAGRERIHAIDTTGPDFKIPEELIAWMVGIREAARYGISFSPHVIQWALDQAFTYKNYE